MKISWRIVKVTYKPWEEIIIHGSIRYSLDDLVKIRSLGVPPGGLGHRLVWAEGIAFSHNAMPPTDEVVKEQLEGKVHCSGGEWEVMPEYEDSIVIRETNVRVPIITVGANPILRSLRSLSIS